MSEGENFDVFSANKKKGILGKISRKNQWIVIVSILILLAFGGYFFFKKVMNIGSSEKEEPASSQSRKKNSIVFLPEFAVDESASLFGGTNYQSENFRVGDIAIGGEAEFLLTENTPEPLEISSIRGESFVEKNKQEVKLVLSWKTNKLAQSEITYSKGVGHAVKTMNEDDYSLNHSLIISGLDQASTYVYTIASQDRFGNTIISAPYAVYTGARTLSLFDLIASAIGDVFGWAISKK